MSDFIHVKTGEGYEKITHINGVQTTHCAHRFEIMCKPTSELHEEQALQALRDWIKWRNASIMQMSGSVSE